MDKTNFLIVIADQLHAGCLGYSGHPVVRTPNIDKLAADGMAFDRMYTNCPVCMPARASLFTGLTPRGHGVRMNGIPLRPDIPTFPEALRLAGYRTHCAGKIHLRPNGAVKGADMKEMEPEDYPEYAGFWRSGQLKQLPSPYYGLESADFYGGCAHGSYGEYLNWIKENHPEHLPTIEGKEALEPPSPAYRLFNRESYKWALPAELHPCTWIADRSIAFLDRMGQDQQQPDGQPFMLMCSIQEPHPPFAPTAPYCYRYTPDQVPDPVVGGEEFRDMPPHYRAIADTNIITSGNPGEPMSATAPYSKECISHYYALIEMLDEQVGRVLASLERNGLAQNTVVVFVADHGDALGEHGLWGKGPYHYQSVIRVPFIVRWPGHTEPGSRYAGVTSLLDIAPTLLSMAGVSQLEGAVPPVRETWHAPPPMPGESLIPVLEGAASRSSASVLVEMDEDYLGFKMRTLVTEQYRITYYSGQSYGELFDLSADPDERQNLWSEPQMRETRDRLLLQLLEQIVASDITMPRQLSRS